MNTVEPKQAGSFILKQYLQERIGEEFTADQLAGTLGVSSGAVGGFMHRATLHGATSVTKTRREGKNKRVSYTWRVLPKITDIYAREAPVHRSKGYKRTDGPHSKALRIEDANTLADQIMERLAKLVTLGSNGLAKYTDAELVAELYARRKT